VRYFSRRPQLSGAQQKNVHFLLHHPVQCPRIGWGDGEVMMDRTHVPSRRRDDGIGDIPQVYAVALAWDGVSRDLMTHEQLVINKVQALHA
jgi:hypothetical protein